MKYLKFISICLMASFAMSVSATVTAQATISVQGDQGQKSTVLKLTQDNSAAANFADPNNATYLPGGSALAPGFYALNGTTKYMDVVLPSLKNVVVKFVANAYETDYTMSFSGVIGNIILVNGTDTAVVEEGETFSFQTSAVSEEVTFTVNPQAANIYTRNVESGKWGTICYDKQIDAVAGADMYEFVGINAAKTKVYVDPVTGTLAAGKAYLFNATAAQQDFTYTGTAVTVVTDNNGLLGVITENFTTTAQAWVVKGNEIMPAAAGSSVPQYRAYVDLDQIQGGEPTTQVPGRKVFNVVGEVTGLEAVEAAAVKDGKMMINGQLVIMKGGKMFNAQGMEL